MGAAMIPVSPGTTRTAPPQWERIPLPLAIDGFEGIDVGKAYEARVADGILRAIITREDGHWHLSISHTDAATRRPGRYPSWDEIKDARYRFIPDRVDMAMHLPPRAEYINTHETTFHLYESGATR